MGLNWGWVDGGAYILMTLPKWNETIRGLNLVKSIAFVWRANTWYDKQGRMLKVLIAAGMHAPWEKISLLLWIGNSIYILWLPGTSHPLSCLWALPMNLAYEPAYEPCIPCLRTSWTSNKVSQRVTIKWWNLWLQVFFHPLSHTYCPGLQLIQELPVSERWLP